MPDQRDFDELLEKFRRHREVMKEELHKVIIGQDAVIDQMLAAIFTGGHCLLVGVPGLAKTLIVSTIARILDVRFKRVNYNQSVERQIYQRMMSERKQIAERFRSEGAGEAAKITGQMEKDLNVIESEAYRKVQEIKGEADGEATGIYAAAYNQSPQAAEFYEFSRTMELYPLIIGGKSTVVLSTDSDLFKYLKQVQPDPLPEGDPIGDGEE